MCNTEHAARGGSLKAQLAGGSSRRTLRSTLHPSRMPPSELRSRSPSVGRDVWLESVLGWGQAPLWAGPSPPPKKRGGGASSHVITAVVEWSGHAHWIAASAYRYITDAGVTGLTCPG